MVHFEVDPANLANRVVTDIDLAPRNDRGLVEFRSNFYLLKAGRRRAGQRHRALRGVEPRRQGHARLLQQRRRQPPPAERRGDGRRVPARERLLAAVARVAVRRAGARGPDAAAHAGGDRRRRDHHRAGAERGGGERAHLRPVARRPQPHRLRGRRPRRPRQRDDRARRRRPAAAGRAARPVALRAARRERRDRRRPDPRLPGGGLRAAQALRHRLRGEGPRPRRPRAGRGARHDLADEVRREPRAGAVGGCDRPRHRLGGVAERALPAHVPLPRLQPRRAGPPRVRRHHVARRRGRARQLQPPVRAAVARRAPVPEQAVSERHLPVHRRRPARPGDGHAGRPALRHPAGHMPRVSTPTRRTSTGGARRRSSTRPSMGRPTRR